MIQYASVLELAYKMDLKSIAYTGLRVRLPSLAPREIMPALVSHRKEGVCSVNEKPFPIGVGKPFFVVAEGTATKPRVLVSWHVMFVQELWGSLQVERMTTNPHIFVLVTQSVE